MKFLLTICLLPLLLGACATTPHTSQEAAEHQAAVIDRWHRCLDNSFTRLENTESPIEGQIETTRVVCQGHKEDVLATFPRHMEKALANVMAEQVYKTGIRHIIGTDKVDVKLQSLTSARLPATTSGQF